MAKLALPGLLSFNAGFVDTAGFLGLQGLFTAHVTGNFVTLGAALVFGTHGVLAKLLALPEFVLVLMVARVVASELRKREVDALRVLLVAKVMFLLAFFVLAVTLGPFPDSDAPAALLTGFAGIAGMAIQNGLQRVHYTTMPPTTLMTGNTTQAALDAVDFWRPEPGTDVAAVRARLRPRGDPLLLCRLLVSRGAGHRRRGDRGPARRVSPIAARSVKFPNLR